MEYWDKYYSIDNTRNITYPSQFAAFVAGEIEQNSFIIDIGCGNGRDSIFFASRAHKVYAIDSSSEAIKSCENSIVGFKNEIKFAISNIGHDKTYQDLKIKFLEYKENLPIVLYSRFFLHAISEDLQNKLLIELYKLSKINPIIFFLEFRTQRDVNLKKETSDHYRRYIVPTDLINKALKIGFELTYQVEGFGFAKYRSDDAYVARIIFRSGC